MHTRRAPLIAAAALCLSQHCLASHNAVVVPDHRGETVKNVIFDTDIWSDIDDALALAMLHTLSDRSEVRLLAVTISTAERSPPSYVNMLNTFYGHPSIPIGITREGMTLEKFGKLYPGLKWPTHYTEKVLAEKDEKGSWVYPRQPMDATTVPEAVKVLRRALASQLDESVVMIQVGYSTNLARLLTSSPDSSSSLGGRDLVARKVKLLSLMAGNFRESTFNGEVIPKGTAEFNLFADIPSAQALFANWPTPIVASGFEIGLALPYPPESISHDYRYVRHHPVAETYMTFCEEQKTMQQMSCPHAHPTFDLTAVLYAVRPDRDYFAVSNPGTITVLEDGQSRFEESPGGRHRYLILNESQRARTLEAMVMLVSQPPVRGNATPGYRKGSRVQR